MPNMIWLIAREHDLSACPRAHNYFFYSCCFRIISTRGRPVPGHDHNRHLFASCDILLSGIIAFGHSRTDEGEETGLSRFSVAANVVVERLHWSRSVPQFNGHQH